jgi:hypothetical protein
VRAVATATIDAREQAIHRVEHSAQVMTLDFDADEVTPLTDDWLERHFPAPGLFAVGARQCDRCAERRTVTRQNARVSPVVGGFDSFRENPSSLGMTPGELKRPIFNGLGRSHRNSPGAVGILVISLPPTSVPSSQDDRVLRFAALARLSREECQESGRCSIW